jgi:hypothetical protein
VRGVEPDGGRADFDDFLPVSGRAGGVVKLKDAMRFPGQLFSAKSYIKISDFSIENWSWKICYFQRPTSSMARGS